MNAGNKHKRTIIDKCQEQWLLNDKSIIDEK